MTCFPSPEDIIALVDPDRTHILGPLGIIKSRARTISERRGFSRGTK